VGTPGRKGFGTTGILGVGTPGRKGFGTTTGLTEDGLPVGLTGIMGGLVKFSCLERR
jgi:hypothetical protein